MRVKQVSARGLAGGAQSRASSIPLNALFVLGPPRPLLPLAPLARPVAAGRITSTGGLGANYHANELAEPWEPPPALVAPPTGRLWRFVGGEMNYYSGLQVVVICFRWLCLHPDQVTNGRPPRNYLSIPRQAPNEPRRYLSRGPPGLLPVVVVAAAGVATSHANNDNS